MARFSSQFPLRVAAAIVTGIFVATFNTSPSQAKSAKELFGGEKAPSQSSPQAIGFYSKGCIAGASAMPVDGPHWQVMRLSRNRRFGHPKLIEIIQDLSEKAVKGGWNGLLVGDMSQARGGPMLTGHASHQIGLDADIWFTPMPNKRLSYDEREQLSAESVLKKYSHYVSDTRWDKSYEYLLKAAASYDDVERILVHPGIKKKLCDTVKGDRSWLNKVRPYYGHHYHFHMRIACQPGSPNCRHQKSTGTSTGCDKSLDWWFKSALGSPMPKKPGKVEKPSKKKEMQLSALPASCAAVLKQPAKDMRTVDLMTINKPFFAPPITIPNLSVAQIMKTRPIEASKVSNARTVAQIRDIPAQVQPPARATAMAQEPVHSAAMFDPVVTQSVAKGALGFVLPMDRVPVPTPRPGK